MCSYPKSESLPPAHPVRHSNRQGVRRAISRRPSDSDGQRIANIWCNILVDNAPVIGPNSVITELFDYVLRTQELWEHVLFKPAIYVVKARMLAKLPLKGFERTPAHI